MKALRSIRRGSYGLGRGLGWVIAALCWRLPARLWNVIVGRGAARILRRLWR